MILTKDLRLLCQEYLGQGGPCISNLIRALRGDLSTTAPRTDSTLMPLLLDGMNVRRAVLVAWNCLINGQKRWVGEWLGRYLEMCRLGSGFSGWWGEKGGQVPVPAAKQLFLRGLSSLFDIPHLLLVI
jgi:hypothetical protein